MSLSSSRNYTTMERLSPRSGTDVGVVTLPLQCSFRSDDTNLILTVHRCDLPIDAESSQLKMVGSQ